MEIYSFREPGAVTITASTSPLDHLRAASFNKPLTPIAAGWPVSQIAPKSRMPSTPAICHQIASSYAP